MVVYERKLYLDQLEQKSKQLDKILFVIGARQVGKTTLLQTFLKKQNLNLKDFLWINWDNLLVKFTNGQELIEYYSFEKKVDFSKLRYLIIDEFHFIHNIGLILKNLIDMVRSGQYQFKIICSGSGSWASFFGKTDALVGRYHLLKVYPFSFGEFVDFKGFNYYDFDLAKFHLFAHRLQMLKKEYLTFGWYPKVVVEEIPQLKREELSLIFDAYISKDIGLFLKGEEIFNYKLFLKLLVQNIWTPISTQALVHKLGLGRKLVEKFLFLFENTFIWTIVNSLKTGEFEGEVSKKKKIYFNDLGLINFLADKPLEEWKATENLALTQLNPYIQPYEQLFFWKKRESEIDFVIQNQIDKDYTLIEIKSGNKDNIPKIFFSWFDNPVLKVSQALVTTQSLYKVRKYKNIEITFVPYLGLEKIFVSRNFKK